MNDYRPAANQLRARRQGKPGELIWASGLVLIVVAIGAMIGLRINNDQYRQLLSQGMVSEATIKDKAAISESYTDRKGRAKTRETWNVTVAHDINAQVPYAKWQAGQSIPTPRYPAVTSQSFDIGQSYYDGLAIGQKTYVVQIPSDYHSIRLVDQVKHETSLVFQALYYLGCAALALGGLAMFVLGWRKRKAAQPPSGLAG